MINDYATAEFVETTNRYGARVTSAYTEELIARTHLATSAVDAIIETAKSHGCGDTGRSAVDKFREEMKRLGVAS